jgi:Tfp pilus assembly protein PilP
MAFKLPHKLIILVVLLLSVLALASCGESSQEKAKAQVCEARSDISKQVKMLSELTLSLSVLSEAKTGLEAIGKDITKIKDAQPNLEPARKEQVQAATHTFEAQVSAILSELESKPSLSKIETQLKSSLTQLAAGYKQALAPLNCS